MTIELWSLLGVALIMFLAVFLQQIVMDRVYGTKYALSNRGQLDSEPSATVERLTRLVRNHVESLVVFTPLVLVATAAGISNNITQTAALVVLVTRFLHLIFYGLGITPFRSLVWGVGFLMAFPAFVYGIVSAAGLPF